MLTIGDFNSFWVFLGHPVQCVPEKKLPLMSAVSAVRSNLNVLIP